MYDNKDDKEIMLHPFVLHGLYFRAKWVISDMFLSFVTYHLFIVDFPV